MGENSIIIAKSDGEEALIDMSQKSEGLKEVIEMMMEHIEETLSSLTEKVMELLRKYATCVITIRGHRAFVAFSLYRWFILRLEPLLLISSYDGVSRMLRRIYLIHRHRTASVADDSAPCGIA